MTDATLPKRNRVLTSAQFRRVFDGKRNVADDTLVVYARENDLAVTRLGLVVSRKIGNAVVRNRWKRLIREVFRLHRARLPTGLDIVVLPRRGVEPNFVRIKRSLPALLGRIARRIRRDSA